MSSSFLNIMDAVDKEIVLILTDGKVFKGTLISVDLHSNLIIARSQEIDTLEHNLEDSSNGLLFIRGDSIAVLGEVGEDMDKSESSQSE